MRLGCYLDNQAMRRLPYFEPGLTFQACYQRAVQGRYAVFGMHADNECYLGEDLTTAVALGTTTDCTNPCYRNMTQLCSGGLRLNLYATVGKRLCGCLRLMGGARALPLVARALASLQCLN